MTLCVLCCLMSAVSLADVWEGSVKAIQTETIDAPADGILEEWTLELGEKLETGASLGKVRSTKAYAPLSGTIAAIHAEVGEELDGTVVEIDPTSPYDLYCSTDQAYRSAETAYVTVGQRVYIKCSVDGSHRAVGRVSSLDGDTFHVEVLGGSLYIGEAVFVFQSDTFGETDRLGVGTVLASETVACTGSGKLIALHVEEGEAVERGQLLFETGSSDQLTVRSETAGIITEIMAAKGQRVTEDEVLARVATQSVLSLTTDIEDKASFEMGKVFSYYRADDPHETLMPCKVTRILTSVADAQLTVELTPENGELPPIGMSIWVTDER